MSDKELHITVASGWSERTGLDVTHEVELVKSALLYADRVTLASPRVSMLASFATVLTLDEQQRADAVRQIVRGLPESADAAAQLDRLERKRHKSPDDLFKLRNMREHFKAAGVELAERVESLLADAGVSELAVAMDAGLLDLDPLGVEEGTTDRMAEHLSALLVEISAPGSQTFPLLDESTNGWLRAMVREGIVPDAAVGFGTEPTLGTKWIGEMEAFPRANMAAVLELREALKEPLVRYRSAIIGIAKQFDSTPLDEGFGREASEAYRQKVEPELLYLAELGRDKHIAALLKHALTTDPGGKAFGAGLGFAGAQAADIPRLIGVAVGAGVDVVSSMYQRQKTVTGEQRRSGFFYLYEAERRLID